MCSYFLYKIVFICSIVCMWGYNEEYYSSQNTMTMAMPVSLYVYSIWEVVYLRKIDTPAL